MTPKELSADLHRTADALRRELREAVEATRDDALETARRFSEGRLSEPIQQAHGPFYSRAQGARANPNIINRWSAVFAGNWVAAPQAGGLGASVWNRDPRAAAFEKGEVDGRPVMVERHPEEAAGDEVEPRFERRVDLAVGRVLG